jgi:hypothetical protein
MNIGISQCVSNVAYRICTMFTKSLLSLGSRALVAYICCFSVYASLSATLCLPHRYGIFLFFKVLMLKLVDNARKFALDGSGR